jgi:hypothetical protein
MLGRLFDHGSMFSTSVTRVAALNAYFKKNPPEGPERTVAQHLLTVCKTFVQAQQRRVDADYNMGIEVTMTESLAQIESVTEAFKRQQRSPRETGRSSEGMTRAAYNPV